MKKVIIELDDGLHAELKSAVYANGQSIKDALTELIKYYITNKMTKKNEK